MIESIDVQLVVPLFQQMSVYLLIAYLFSKTPLFRPLANLSSWPIHNPSQVVEIAQATSVKPPSE